MSDGLNGDWKSLPTIARSIAIVGIPGAIAMFLVVVGAYRLPAIDRQTIMNNAAILDNRKLIEQDLIRHEAAIRMLQRICSRVSKSEQERAQCFDQ